jgi:hypothetical protein
LKNGGKSRFYDHGQHEELDEQIESLADGVVALRDALGECRAAKKNREQGGPHENFVESRHEASPRVSDRFRCRVFETVALFDFIGRIRARCFTLKLMEIGKSRSFFIALPDGFSAEFIVGNMEVPCSGRWMTGADRKFEVCRHVEACRHGSCGIRGNIGLAVPVVLRVGSGSEIRAGKNRGSRVTIGMRTFSPRRFQMVEPRACFKPGGER